MADKEYQKYQTQGLRSKYIKSKLVSNNEANNSDSKSFTQNKTGNISNTYSTNKESSPTKNLQDDNLTGFLVSNKIDSSKDISFELSDEEIDLFSELSMKSEQSLEKNKTEYIKPSNTTLNNQTIDLTSKNDKNYVLTVDEKDISFEKKKNPKKKANYKLIIYSIIAAIAWLIIILFLLWILYIDIKK